MQVGTQTSSLWRVLPPALCRTSRRGPRGEVEVPQCRDLAEDELPIMKMDNLKGER